MVELISIHFHIDGGKLIVQLGNTKVNIALIRIGLAILGIPIMLYALPPQNNPLLFIISIGFWGIAVLFGNLNSMAMRVSS